MISRRTFSSLATACAAAFTVDGFARSPASAAVLGDNGLHIQDWFLESFLDLNEDQTAASQNGKLLAVLFEQRGCPYCREMHTVNLARQEIRSYLKSNFEILQLDLWGARAVTDFDGAELEERALARKWRVNFTPTFVFFADRTQQPSGKSGADLEVARMPGYFKPFHFLSMFEYVRQGLYDRQPFQRYLQDKFAALEAKGIKPDVW